MRRSSIIPLALGMVLVRCTFPLPEVLPQPKPAAVFGQGDVGSTGLSTTTDGTAEGIWRGFPRLAVDRLVAGEVASTADLSASFQAIADDNGLSLLVAVKDDQKIAAADGGWNGDGVEVFLDLTGSAPPAVYTTQVFRYFFAWNSTSPLEVRGRVTGVKLASINLSDGYQVEMYIPWATLGRTPERGSSIGFELMVADDDGHGLEGKLAWFGHDEKAESDPRRFGTARLSRGLLINATGSPPAIDGSSDPVWDQQSVFPLKRTVLGSTKRGADLTGNFSAMWDESYLYVLMDARDDDRQPNGTSKTDSDGVEFFLDGLNTGASTYGKGGVVIVVGHGADGGVFLKGSAEGASFAQANDSFPGYRVEGRIPWTALQTRDVDAGTELGFETWLNDYDVPAPDAGVPTLRRISLFSDAGTAEQSPASLGTLELVGHP